MTLTIAIIGLVAGLALWAYGFWREKKKQLGHVPILSPFAYQFLGLIVTLVMAANLVALLTGVEWKSPFMR
ncbi:MAG: hypothetical protein HWE25_11300 [Alphaproteobacteria bacterium]|nr:hypothetical protein [Alphaproteobacteria bacterium]